MTKQAQILHYFGLVWVLLHHVALHFIFYLVGAQLYLRNVGALACFLFLLYFPPKYQML